MSEPSPALLPPDPTFPPVAYERVARLLRWGALGFLLLAGAGLIGTLAVDPSETVAGLLSSGPPAGYGTFRVFLDHIEAGQPDALILLGIYVMVAVTVGRVALVTYDLFRGGERTLGWVSSGVVVLLLVALFVVAPFVR